MISTQKQTITVSQLNRFVYRLLGSQSILQDFQIRGELSNVKVYSSGHWYFNLKDENAQVHCVMFKFNAQKLNFRPKDGDEVILRGQATLYERDGNFQIRVSEMEKAGKGNLYQLFLQLNKKLRAEGLYNPEHKQDIPKFPKVIGVATSRSGAVIQDIINVSRRRWPMAKILLCPCSVQGFGASDSIVRSIERLNALPEVDVIIVGRGGGSLEDLWPFNEENVARAVYASKKPIISAVGHESDTTICDYVADKRAPTPSAAAEIALPNMDDIWNTLDSQDRQLHKLLLSGLENVIANLNNKTLRLQAAMERKLSTYRQRLENLANNRYLQDPMENIKKRSEIIENNAVKLEDGIRLYLRDKENDLLRNVSRLDALSPLKILSRGYAMVTDKDANPLISSKNIDLGDDLFLHMRDGNLEVNVTDKIEQDLDNESLR